MDRGSTINAYERIRALMPRVDNSKTWYGESVRADPRLRILGRRDRGAPRDRVYCGLAAKAMQTHAAIRLLVDADDAENALALTRVIIENMVVMMWIGRDIVFRLDAYCASSDLHDHRLAYAAQTHYADISPKMAATATEHFRVSTPMAELLGGRHHPWARRVNDLTGKLEQVQLVDMFDEVFGKPAAPAGIRSSLYDIAYFKGSQPIHSTIASVAASIPWEDRYFTLRVVNRPMSAGRHLAVANIAVVSVLNELQNYLKDPIFQPELDEIARSISSQLDEIAKNTGENDGS